MVQNDQGEGPPGANDASTERRLRDLSREELHLWTLATAKVAKRAARARKRGPARHTGGQLVANDKAALPTAPGQDISRDAFARMLAESFVDGTKEAAKTKRDLAPAGVEKLAIPTQTGTPIGAWPGANRRNRAQRLDLHGLTLQAAYQAVREFVTVHRERGHRDLLIITGKGDSVQRDASGARPIAIGGNLRRELPIWLTTPVLAQWVDAFGTAPPDQGGEGAFWVKLRPKR